MVSITGHTLQSLAEIYDASPPEVQQWVLENLHLAFGKDKLE